MALARSHDLPISPSSNVKSQWSNQPHGYLAMNVQPLRGHKSRSNLPLRISCLADGQVLQSHLTAELSMQARPPQAPALARTSRLTNAYITVLLRVRSAREGDHLHGHAGAEAQADARAVPDLQHVARAAVQVQRQREPGRQPTTLLRRFPRTLSGLKGLLGVQIHIQRLQLRFILVC